MANDFAKFQEIRSLYAAALPEWLDDYQATGNMWHDPYLMDWEFSPIEQLVWGDIRQLAVPFYPQIPVLNYFLDFANPFLKIGIECDGKAWHDKHRDQARDARLAAAGWMIFRIEGHECVREVDIHGHSSSEEREAINMAKYYGATSEGIVRAIKHAYFDEEPLERGGYMVRATLFNHRSTPETFPRRRPLTPRHDGPVRLDKMLEGYMELLQRRVQRHAA
jgi:hypothetical protein